MLTNQRNLVMTTRGSLRCDLRSPNVVDGSRLHFRVHAIGMPVILRSYDVFLLPRPLFLNRYMTILEDYQTLIHFRGYSGNIRQQVYTTICSDVHHHLLRCTPPSAQMYTAICSDVHRHLLRCTPPSAQMYTAICSDVHHHLLSWQ